MFVARADTAESKPLDLPSGDILAISPAGEMLLSLGRRYLTSWTSEGTLARARLFGSSAREVLEHVRDADFLPGDRLAIVRRVERPRPAGGAAGTAVFETPGYISHVRVSPDGQQRGFPRASALRRQPRLRRPLRRDAHTPADARVQAASKRWHGPPTAAKSGTAPRPPNRTGRSRPSIRRRPSRGTAAPCGTCRATCSCSISTPAAACS